METKGKTLFERFHSLIGNKADCWEWGGYIDNFGYGRIMTKGGPTRAHRVSYLLHHGEIPRGSYILHKCDNRKCVNPAHLYAGNARQNAADKVNRGRAYTGNHKGIVHPQAKLTEADVYAIRASASPNPELAKMYGVTASAICMIKRRRTWSHLPEKEYFNGNQAIE